MDERALALRETGRRKVRRETICPAMTRSRFRTRTAQLRLFELVSLVHPRRASDTRDGLRTHADPVNAPRVRPHQLEEFRRARERRAECFAEGTPVQSAIVHRTRERREALAHARHHEKQRRAKARGVADLDTLRCFDDELRASEVVCGSPGASSEDDLRRQIEALRVGKRSAEAEASRLRGEVRHLEDLVDGLVKLLESAGEEMSARQKLATEFRLRKKAILQHMLEGLGAADGAEKEGDAAKEGDEAKGEEKK